MYTVMLHRRVSRPTTTYLLGYTLLLSNQSTTTIPLDIYNSSRSKNTTRSYNYGMHPMRRVSGGLCNHHAIDKREIVTYI